MILSMAGLSRIALAYSAVPALILENAQRHSLIILELL